jgi:C-terminal domain on Strawberry notch homologue/ddrB-like ParB superfamily domain
MALPSELNPSIRPNRIQGTAFAGPEPSEALARLKKRKEEEEASQPKPAPAPTYISRSDANKLNQIAKQEAKASEDRSNAQTERTLDTAGVKHRQVAGGGVEPKVTSDNKGMPTLEWGSGETQNELGGTTKYDEFGSPINKPEVPVQIKTGNKDYGEDPNAIYRVPMGKPQVEGATPERDATRKSKRIGSIDELTNSDDEAIRTIARDERTSRDNKIYGEAFRGLKATEDELRAGIGDLKSQIETAKNNPPPISADATDDQRAEYAKRMAEEEQARTKELNEKESQLAKHKMLQAELAKQKQKEATFNALMQRGQDVRKQGIVKADGTKSNDPKDDPIYAELQKSASSLNLGNLDPEAPALPKALEGMIPSAVNGMMIGLPESEQAKGVRQEAEQVKKSVDANLENRKQKLSEYTDEIKKPAVNARAVWTLLRKKTDLAIAQHNELLKSGSQEEIDASSKAIDVLEADLKAKLPSVIMGNQSLESAQQLEKDTIDSAKQEAKTQKESIDAQASQMAGATNQRVFLGNPKESPKPPILPEDPKEAVNKLPEAVKNKDIPISVAVKASKAIPENPQAKTALNNEIKAVQQKAANYSEAVRQSTKDEWDDSYKDLKNIYRGGEVALRQTIPIVKGMIALGGATAERFFGQGGVSTDVKNWGYNGYKEGMAGAEALHQDNDEVTTAWAKAKDGDVGAMVDWMTYGLGYLGGQLTETVAMSIIGGITGSAAEPGLGTLAGVGTGAVAKGMLREAAGKLVGKMIAKEIEETAVKTGVKISSEQAIKQIAKGAGSTALIGANAFTQELGTIYPTLVDEKKKSGQEITGTDLARVWATGIVAGGMESLSDKLGLEVLFHGQFPLIPQKFKNIAKDSKAIAGLLGFGWTGALEGGTEFGQTWLERLGAGQTLNDKSAWQDYINSGALGFLGGATIGGYSGFIHGIEGNEEAGHEQVINELKKGSADVPQGGWEAWANKLGQTGPSEVVLNARSLADSEPEAKGLKPAERLIAIGQQLDAKLSEGLDINKQAYYWACRADIADAIQTLASAQNQAKEQIQALSDTPASKSEVSPRQAAIAAAYVITGGQPTIESEKYKLNGVPIFQHTADGSTILEPAFAERFAKDVPAITKYQEVKADIGRIEYAVSSFEYDPSASGMAGADLWRRNRGNVEAEAETAQTTEPPEKPILENSPSKLLQRPNNVLVGKTSAERIESAKLKTTELAKGMAVDGIKLNYEEGEIGGTSMNANINNDGSISLRVDPTHFKFQDSQDAEINNRAFNEELLHLADFSVSIKEAKAKGLSPDQYASYHVKRRNDLFNKILEVGESDTQVLKALISSISLYDPSTNFDGSPAGVDEIRGYLAGDEVKTMQVMSEMLRQLGTIEKKGGLTESRIELRGAAQGKYSSGEKAVGVKVTELISQIKQYLMAVYKSLSRMRKALSSANPQVGAELDDLLNRIQDVLKGKKVDWSGYGVPPASITGQRSGGLVQPNLPSTGANPRPTSPAPEAQTQPEPVTELEQTTEQTEPPAPPAPPAPPEPPAPPAPPVPPAPPAPAKQNTIKAFTQGFTGSTVIGTPKIIEATEAKDMEGTDIQPRNRKDRKAYKELIETMARNWDPDKAMPGTSTGDGAPILTAENKIVSGHGRIKAMMEMFRRYPERAAAYRAKLMEVFPEMADQIRNMKMPIVITEMDLTASFEESNKTATGLGVNKTPEQFLRRLAVRANAGTLATEELAVADAREIQDNPELRDIKQNENGDLSETPDNVAIQQKFFEIFGSPQQYRNNDETFTKSFKDRVTSALLADAIASSNNGKITDSEKIIISAITDPENSNAGVKTLAAALTKSVTRLVSLRQIATEVLGAEKASQLDPLVPIAKSLQAYLEAKRSGGENTPKDWQSFVENNRSQIPGLAENILDQTSADVFQPIYDFRDSSAKLSSYLNNLASELEAKIQDLKDMGETDIFGNRVPIIASENSFGETIQSAAQKAVEKTLSKTRLSSRGLPAPDPREEQIDKDQEKAELQESWTPVGEEESKKIDGYYSLGLQAPANLAPEQTSAINELVKEVGPIPQYVAKMIGIPVDKIFKRDDGEERLSAEALETIALSINQIEKGKSLTIGHEMGVGKGRIVGSIMAVYALKKGLIPVFVTKSEPLYPAMLDDIEDVGFEGQIKPLITNNNWSSMRSKGRPVTMKNPIQKLRLTAQTGKMPSEHNAVFTTYAQISSVAKKDVIPALNAIADRAIFILDESHNAAGTDSSIGEFFRSVIPLSRGAVFSSATAIKSPANIATYFPKTSIPMAVPTASEFERLAKRFGNPFMQMTSSMLSRAGQMFRLQSGFTWKGQKIPFIPSPIKAKQEVIDAHNAANEILGEMRQIEIGEKMKKLTQQLVQDAQEAYDGTEAKALIYPLSGQFHNVAANMVLGAKIKDTADLAEAEIKAGRKVFISMDTTGEAFLRDAKEIMEGGSLQNYDKVSKVTFKDFMERYARKLNTNKVKIGPKDEKSNAPSLEFNIDWNKTSGKSNIPNWVSQKSIELHDSLMETGFKDLALIIKDNAETLNKLPISPFDALRAELQRRQILSAEISGRDIAVTPSGAFSQRSVTDQDKQNSLIAFRNNDQTKVLIVSRTGSTGLSAHDDPRNKSSAPRTHIVMQPAPDIVDTIQVLGRTNRNNQQSAPKLVYIYSEDIPAEVRIMAMTQKKMRRLGASTTGKDATAAGENLGLDMLNTYGDNAVALVLANEPELRTAYNTRAGTNFPEKYDDIKKILTSGEPGDGMRRMIHKALILDIEDQRHFFEEITAEYVAMVDFAKQNGTYELESQEKDYKADKLSDEKAWDAYGVATGDKENTQDTGTDAFSKPARIAKYRFNNPTPPPTSAELIPTLEQAKQQAETAVSDFLKASDSVLKDKLARISSNPRMEQLAKVRALENTRKKSAEVRANVERALDLVGKGAWFGKDTKQIPAYVVGVELNNRFPHAESRQYLVLQTSGFENKVRIPLQASELAHVNPFKVSLDKSPIGENEAPTRDPSVDPLSLPVGIYRNTDGSGLVVFMRGPRRHSVDTLPPEQLREVNAVAYEMAVQMHESGIEESEIENRVFNEAINKVLTTGDNALDPDSWNRYVEEKMPESRKGDGFGKTYDRSRQNATQRDQFVVEGNLLTGANFVSSMFGALVPAAVTTFTTKDGGKTTGVVMPAGVNSDNLVNLKAEVAKGQGSLLGPVGKVMDNIIDEEGRPRPVVFSDGSMISGHSLYIPDKAFLDDKNEGYRKEALDNSNAIATMIVAKINQGHDAWMYRGPKNGFSLRSRGLKREAGQGRAKEQIVEGFLTDDNAKDFSPEGVIGRNIRYKAMKASDDGWLQAGNLGEDEIYENLYDYAIALQAQINQRHGQNTKGELIENVPNFILSAVDNRIKQMQEEAKSRETISKDAPISGTFNEEGDVEQEEASVGDYMAQKEAPESNKELYDKLEKVMASLADSDRKIFMMYVSGASYQQISETPEAYKSRNVGNLDGEVAPDRFWVFKHIQSLKGQLSKYANFLGVEAPTAKEEPTEASPMEGFKAIEETKGQMTLFSRGLVNYLDKNAGNSVLFRDLLTAVANEPDALPSQRALAKLLTTPNTKQSMMTAGLYVPAEINPDPTFVRSYYKPSKEGNGMVVLSLNGIKNSGEPIETTIHEYKHVLTHNLLVKEGIGTATGKKELDRLVEYSNRPDIEMDAEGNPLPLANGSKGGYKPLKALIKAYLAAVNVSKDTAGNPVADAVFGTGLASTYDVTLHMAPYEEPIGQDGIHMKAEITSENTFPLLKYLKDQGLEGTRPMGRNSGMSLVASKGSPDFVFLNQTDEEALGGMEASGVQNTTLVLTPSGIEKLRQQDLEPLFYASYKVRATAPMFRTKVTDIQTDPQKVRSIYYGLGNIHEFVTEMYSDNRFQTEMASIPGQAGIEINGNLKEYMQALAAELPQEARNAMMQNSAIKPTILTQGQSAALELSSQPFDFMKMVENLRQGNVEKKLEQATLFSRGIKIQDKDRNNIDVLKSKLLQLHKKKHGSYQKEDDGYYRPIPPQQLSSQEEALYTMLMDKARAEKWPGIAFQSDLMQVETSTKPENLVLEQQSAVPEVEAPKMEQLSLFSRGLMESVSTALNEANPVSASIRAMDQIAPTSSTPRGRMNQIKSDTLQDFIQTAMLPESFEIKYKGKGLNPTQLRIEYLKQNPETLRRMLYKEKGKDPAKKLFSRGLPADPVDPMNNGDQQAPLNDLLASFLGASGNIITDEEIDATYQRASEENAPYEVGAPYVGQDVRSAGPFANDQFRDVQRVARELRRPIDTVETDASVLAAAKALVATHKAQLYEDLLEGTLETSATNQAAVYLALAEDAKNAKTPEELREIAILTMANDIQRTNLARAMRIGRDSQMTPEERNRSFFNAELYRRSPDSNELYRNAISRTLKTRSIASNEEQIRLLQAELDLARSQAGEAFEANEQWQKWGAYMEGRIKEFQDANQLWADQLDKYQVLEQESARKIEALQAELAKANTSLEQMDWETAQLKIRESKSAQDVLDTIQMSNDDAEAIRLVMAGMVPMAAAKQAGIKPARVMQLMKSLETNTKQRFDQVAGELATQGITRSQLKAKLTAFANGASLRSRGIEANQEEAPLTKEEILAEIVSAMGFDYAGQSDTSGKADWHNVDGKSSLFDWRKPSNIGVAMQMVRRSQGKQASIGDAVFEAHVALLVSSTSTQLANVSKTPLTFLNPFYRMVEAGMSYLIGKAGLNVRLPDGTIGNPYASVSDVVNGATDEARLGFMAMVPSVINGTRYARLAFNTEKPFYNIDHTDATLLDEGDQKFYENDPKIPGKLGKKVRLPLRALLAADEFAKSFAAETLVGSIAYRIARAKGLNGQERVDYVRNQVSEFGSDSWKIAVERSSRETLNEDVAENKDEPFTFKRLGKAAPRALNKFSKGISDLSQNLESWGFDPNNGARVVTAPVAFAGSMGLQILRGLTLFARISYNVLQRGLAFTPVGLADSAIGAMNSVKTTKEIKGKKHVVAKGETLQSISDYYNNQKKQFADWRMSLNDVQDMTPSLLRNANGITSSDQEVLKEDSSINIPIYIPQRKFMDLTNYENAVAGLTEGAIGTAILMALFRSMEGDKDDDKKLLLITGPAAQADSASRTTRYGNRSYMIRIGNKEFDISRIEPFASAMGFGVALGTAVKDAVHRGGGIAVSQNLVGDFSRILSQKTFGGQLRTAKTLFADWNIVDPVIDFASVFTAPPIARGLVEASKDYVSRTASEEPSLLNKDRMLSKFAPVIGAYPNATGYRTPYAYDYEGKKVVKPFTEVVPNSTAGKVAKFALRNLSPVAVYKKKPASKLNRFVESYNRQQISTEGKTWILNSPRAEITDPYSKKKVRLTLREQETLNSIVQPQLQALFEVNITEADIANPTDKKKQRIQDLASKLRNKYEEQIIRQRYAMGDAKQTK